MPDGKSVQGGTSHHLGQSFAEAFDITYVDEDEEERTAYTTSGSPGVHSERWS